jgi:hypothetical protein
LRGHGVLSAESWLDFKLDEPGWQGQCQGSERIRMKRTSLVAYHLLVLAVGIGAGCKKEESAGQNRAVDATLANRPLILSQPAPNRRAWIVQTLQQGYRDTARTNAAWDNAVQRAFEAFADYSRVSTTNWPSLKKALGDVPASCDDPMIQYMRVRYREESQSLEKTAGDFVQAREVMLRSRYHPLFKFTAGARAAQAGRDADVDRTIRRETLGETAASLVALARDTNAPSDEVFESVNLWLSLGPGARDQWIAFVTDNHLEEVLERNWGQTEPWFRFSGKMEIERAWAERGGGWASTVNEKGFQGFEKHLAKADKALTKAWQMDSNKAETAYLMMRVELGQGQGRSRMDTWFRRAMSLRTNYFDAAQLMSFYLEPRWYGSDATALAFGRSCVASTNWGGQVPLVLVRLHHSLAKYHQTTDAAYWQRPQVWKDVKASYEKFFALNPGADRWRHDYAMDAYNCGQPAVFLEQTKLFASGTNYTFFGGKEKFEEMLESANKAMKRP